jgi:hypothetical protein
VASAIETDLHIDIKTPQLYLNTPVKFEGLKSLIVKGNSTIITCITSANSSAGVQLSHIADSIKLNNLILKSCGTEKQG